MKYLSVVFQEGDEFAEMHESASEAIKGARRKFNHLSVEGKRCTVEAWQVKDHSFVKDEDGNEIPGGICCIIWSSEEQNEFFCNG